MKVVFPDEQVSKCLTHFITSQISTRHKRRVPTDMWRGIRTKIEKYIKDLIRYYFLSVFSVCIFCLSILSYSIIIARLSVYILSSYDVIIYHLKMFSLFVECARVLQSSPTLLRTQSICAFIFPSSELLTSLFNTMLLAKMVGHLNINLD